MQCYYKEPLIKLLSSLASTTVCCLGDPMTGRLFYARNQIREWRLIEDAKDEARSFNSIDINVNVRVTHIF